MKNLFKIFLLLCCINLQAQQKTVQKQLNSEGMTLPSKVDLSITSKQHLDLMLNDLTAKKAFSKTNITILDNYEMLSGYKYETKRYSFQVTDKVGLNLDAANNILFWRMDIAPTKAHYEFYLNQSEKVSVKYTYYFELKNDKWQIQSK